MKPRHHDFRQLSELLEAESEGRPFDRVKARQLAEQLAQLCPDISQTMRLVERRMAN